MGSLKLLYTHLQNLTAILETFYFPQTVRVLSKSTPNVQSSIKFQQKPTTICLIICKHSKHTKLRHPNLCCVGVRGRNKRNKKWNLSTGYIALIADITREAFELILNSMIDNHSVNLNIIVKRECLSLPKESC